MSEQDDFNDEGWDNVEPSAEDEGELDGQAQSAGDDSNNEVRQHDPRGSHPGDRGARNGRPRRAEDFMPPDERARQGLDFVREVVFQMGMDCRVRLRRPKEGNAEDEINLEITGRDAGRIIGKKGQVLLALQFLIHRVVNRPGQDRRHISLDAEGYRSRRDNSLASMARRLGKQAVEEGKIITFEPMNPRDRRVVHLALAKFEGVVTRSEGEGDDRRVQIIPVRRTGSGNGPGLTVAVPETE